MNDVDYLNETVWATLKPSDIHGVGVFAIRDIPKGTMITDYSVHNIKDIRLMVVKVEDFDKIKKEIRDLILDRTTFQEGQEVFRFISPNHEQTLQSFMNHSDQPNFDGAISTRDIKKGEEITEDYRMLAKLAHPLVAKHYNFL